MRWHLAVAAISCVVALSYVQAQHNHDHGHPDYRDWRSQRAPQSCCNDQDCGSLKDDEVRQTAAGPEVKIGGDWCPVLPEHYLTRGKSPDWSVAHACVMPYGDGCSRLLCYSEKGGF